MSLFIATTQTSSFRLYHTENMLIDGDHDCIYHYGSFAEGRAKQLVSYCIRLPELSTHSEPFCHGTYHTFSSLLNANISIKDLFESQAPVDLITQYEYYLTSGHGAENRWCNCSLTRDRSFGTGCQYTFVFDANTFADILEDLFIVKDERDLRTLTNDDFTCYSILNCTTYSGLCLDWRQVCDGMRDCINGRDEQNCIEMELSECDSQLEYRCSNGMCIPRGFAFDLTMDCMDFYDEQRYRDTSNNCHMNASIDCEEHTCGLSQFSCGDGSCQHEWDTVDSSTECKNKRIFLYLKHIYVYKKEANMTVDCWQHMWCYHNISCLFELSSENITTCDCSLDENRSFSCPTMYFFPPTHFVFPFVKILYEGTTVTEYNRTLAPTLLAICYNISVCDIYRDYQSFVVDGYDCLSIDLLDPYSIKKNVNSANVALTLAVIIQNLFSQCLTIQSAIPTSLYACKNRLLISHHRRFDQHEDCYPWPYTDEKYMSTCDRNWTDRFRCKRGNDLRCIPRRLLHDGNIDCFDTQDELFPSGCTNDFDCQYLREYDLNKSLPIAYEELCNGYAEIGDTGDTGGAESDETNCDQWPCDAQGTRCDNIWNRPNGCDELNCPQTIPYFITRHVANCSANEHYCFQYNNSRITCLPVAKAGDGHIDCLFGSDERTASYLHRCRDMDPFFLSALLMCDGIKDCSLGDDELMCPWRTPLSCPIRAFACKNGTCLSSNHRCNGHIDCTDAEDEWLCEIDMLILAIKPYKPFAIEHFNKTQNSIVLRHRRISSDSHLHFICHRGIPAYVVKGNEIRCFCPPGYFGIHCEQQSERLTISYTVETLMISKSQTIYLLVFYLLNGQNEALNMETFVYAPAAYSEKKQYIYLKYPRRNQSLINLDKLFVRIDAYIVTRNTIDFYLAWLYQIQFPFLPVNRLAARLLMEERRINQTICAQLGCKHGACRAFVNNGQHFCQCIANWTGSRCDQPSIRLNCSSSAKSVMSYGHAFCLCPVGRTGSECRVTYDFCLNTKCQNDGTCLSLDVRTEEHVCICKNNYFGNECQYLSAYLVLHIPDDMDLIPALSIHLLHSPTILPGILLHRDIQFYRNIQPNTDLLIYEHNQLHLSTFIFAQLMLDLTSHYGFYYLLALLPENRTNLSISIQVENRCPHVSERLDPIVMQFEWLKRVKFYHMHFKNVRCFYDEVYMCLIDDQQLPYCLQFNHELSNCTERNYCENGGRCLQRKREGGLNFACVCPKCVSGSFCQLRLEQFYLTLDSILGDAIMTDVSLQQQSLLIKVLVALIIVMFVVGLVSNIISCFTFHDKKIRQVGCGNYLFVLTLFNQITLSVFVARFIYLIIGQMTIIRNKESLTVGCSILDFVLSLHIYVCDWLTACVACERTVNVIKGVKFNRKKSVNIVKFVVPLLCIVVTLTSLHQPFTRTLISDPRNDERFWCVINFRYTELKYYTITINLFHTITPFLVNFFSAIILLVFFAQTKQRTNATDKYINIVVAQVREHKHIIISPLLMIILKLPSIIVMLVIKCIESNWQLYLSVITYFLSLAPLTMTFIVYILPASSYMEILAEKSRRHWKRRNI